MCPSSTAATGKLWTRWPRRTLRLDELEKFLAHWRRIARSATARGHDHWRAVLARAEHTLRTGKPPPGTVSEKEIEDFIRARLGVGVPGQNLSRTRDVIACPPEVALAGYTQALGVMKLVPWSGESINKANPGGEVRQLVFGPEGREMVTYLVLEDQQLADMLEVQWVGK